MSYDELVILRNDLSELVDQILNCLVKVQVLKIRFDEILLEREKKKNGLL